MSYEPTKWQTGDIITLNKLNKLEQGVAAMMEEYEPTVWQIGDTVTSTKLNKLEQAVATLSENGGGTTLGSMQYVVVYDTSKPTVGGDAYYVPLSISTVHVGSQLVIGEMPGADNGCPNVAAGATVKAYAPMDMLGENPVITPYVITDSAEQKYTSVTPWDGTYTHAIEQIDNQDCLAITLTVPELDASEGERLVFAIIGGEALE